MSGAIANLRAKLAGRGKKPPEIRFGSPWWGELDDHVIALAWSPDGKTLAAASISGPVTLFDTATGDGRVLAGHRGGTLSLAWNPRGEMLATSGQDGNVRVWVAATGEEKFVLEGGASWVEQVAWADFGNVLASAAGRHIRLWNGCHGTLLRSLPDASGSLRGLLWKPGEQEIAALGGKGVAFWNMEGATSRGGLALPGGIAAAAWRPDGKWLAVGGQSYDVTLFDLATLNVYGAQEHECKVRELSWDATNRYLATGGATHVFVWDTQSPRLGDAPPMALGPHPAFISAVAFQRRGGLLASGDSEEGLMLWSPPHEHKPLKAIRMTQGIAHLAWSPDDKLLAIGGASGGVTVCQCE